MVKIERMQEKLVAHVSNIEKSLPMSSMSSIFSMFSIGIDITGK